MRERKRRLVVTFHSTAEAMAFESLVKTEQLPGRLIPVPASIRAGCGLAFMASADEAEQVISFINQSGISYEAIRNHDL